jgi:hypothetical protein
MRQLKEIQVV